MHKQAYMMVTLIQELRNEEQFVADFANGVVRRQRVWMADNGFVLSVVLLGTFGIFGLSLLLLQHLPCRNATLHWWDGE